MAWTLTGITGDFGDYVQRETVSKASQIIPQPTPGLDSDDSPAWDFGGAVRIITLSLKYGGTAAEQKTKVDEWLALVTGDQQDTISYVSELFTTAIKVKVLDVVVNRAEPEMRYSYVTVRLVEASY